MITKTSFRNFLWIPHTLCTKHTRWIFLKKTLYFNELAPFDQFIKYMLFRSPFSPLFCCRRSPFGPLFTQNQVPFLTNLGPLSMWEQWHRRRPVHGVQNCEGCGCSGELSPNLPNNAHCAARRGWCGLGGCMDNDEKAAFTQLHRQCSLCDLIIALSSRHSKQAKTLPQPSSRHFQPIFHNLRVSIHPRDVVHCNASEILIQ